MRYAFGETVTRLRATAATDPFSGEDTALDWDDPGTLDIPGIAVAPGAFVENNTPDRTRVDVSFTLYGDFGDDIEPLDRVVVRGLTCEVIGQRQDWRSPFTGLQAGSVIEVRQVAG